MEERTADFGSFFKAWRKLRQLSQSELAERIDVSERHLSFIENNHAKPNRECIQAIIQALNIPPQAVVVAMGSVGLPVIEKWDINDDYFQGYKASLDFILEKQDPYPVWVFDNALNTVTRNQAHVKKWQLIEEELGGLATENLFDMYFHPEGLRLCVANWQEPARHLLKLVQMASHYGVPGFKDRLKRLLNFPGIKKLLDPTSRSNPSPLVKEVYRLKGKEITLLAGPLMLGSIMDRAAFNFNMVCYFPVDTQAEKFCKSISQKNPKHHKFQPRIKAAVQKTKLRFKGYSYKVRQGYTIQE